MEKPKKSVQAGNIVLFIKPTTFSDDDISYTSEAVFIMGASNASTTGKIVIYPPTTQDSKK